MRKHKKLVKILSPLNLILCYGKIVTFDNVP